MTRKNAITRVVVRREPCPVTAHHFGVYVLARVAAAGIDTRGLAPRPITPPAPQAPHAQAEHRRSPRPTLRVVSIEMADGSDLDSPEARARIARALLSPSTPPAPRASEEQPTASRAG